MLSLQAKAILILILAAGLSFGLWTFGEHRYHAGEAHTQAAWDAEKVIQLQAAAKEQQKHDAETEALQSDFREERNAYQTKTAHDAVLIAGNASALDGLRQRLAADASRGQLSQDPASRSSADGEAAQLRSDLESCASRYQQLGAEAAGYSRQIEALQAIAVKLPQVLNGEQP